MGSRSRSPGTMIENHCEKRGHIDDFLVLKIGRSNCLSVFYELDLYVSKRYFFFISVIDKYYVSTHVSNLVQFWPSYLSEIMHLKAKLFRLLLDLITWPQDLETYTESLNVIYWDIRLREYQNKFEWPRPHLWSFLAHTSSLCSKNFHKSRRAITLHSIKSVVTFSNATFFNNDNYYLVWK